MYHMLSMSVTHRLGFLTSSALLGIRPGCLKALRYSREGGVLMNNMRPRWMLGPSQSELDGCDVSAFKYMAYKLLQNNFASSPRHSARSKRHRVASVFKPESGQ